MSSIAKQLELANRKSYNHELLAVNLKNVVGSGAGMARS